MRLLPLVWIGWLCASFAASAQPASATPRVPLIYCTDLFHPHDDPDDHFDLATAFALTEFDLKCIILDQGDEQLKRPGTVPVAQLNQITGRNVPSFPGLGAKLRDPRDPGLNQPAEFQAGVTAILAALRESDTPVTIITVGSTRDVVAAFNREPSLFYDKVSRVAAFIGEATKPNFREWNVGLDPEAFIGLLRSGLPLYWVPCFDGGEWQNGGHASFWQANHGDLLSNAPPQVIQYFIYALGKKTLHPLRFLDFPIEPAERSELLAGTRNLWVAAILGSFASRELVCEDDHYLFRRRQGRHAEDPHLRNALFDFEPVPVRVTDAGGVKYGAHPDAHKVWRFAIRDRSNYARGLTEATAGLLATLAKPLPPVPPATNTAASATVTQTHAPAPSLVVTNTVTHSNAPVVAPFPQFTSALWSNSVFCISNRVHGKDGTDTNRARMLFSAQKWTTNSTTAAVRNTHGWLHGAKGITAISSWNAAVVYFSPGTPVSPRHIVMASHNRTTPTNTFEFVTLNNEVITRKMIAQTLLTNVPDLTIGLLDDDLPASIGFLRVMPPAWRALLPAAFKTTQAEFIANLGKRHLRETTCPVVAFNHWKQAFVADFAGVGLYPDFGVWFPDWFGHAAGGDSGHPLCVLTDDELILFAHFTTTTGGTPYPDFIPQINAAMEALSRAHLAPVYHLTVANDLMRFQAEHPAPQP